MFQRLPPVVDIRYRSNRTIIAVAAALLFSPAGATAAEDRPCASCHAEIEKPAKSVHAALGMGCDTCHQTVAGKAHPAEKKSIALTSKGAALCFACHEEAKFKAKVVHAPAAEGLCLDCHRPHTSATAALLSSPVPELCVACHADKALDEKAVVQHAPFAAGDCMGCHVPHAGDTPGLLKPGLLKSAIAKP
ncbi:MAG: cytochrome c3 family protein, partial [Acidobacteriota bacterium]|nr:cytochrome c3 family protein [Acidobacteriota bacterium]